MPTIPCSILRSHLDTRVMIFVTSDVFKAIVKGLFKDGHTPFLLEWCPRLDSNQH